MFMFVYVFILLSIELCVVHTGTGLKCQRVIASIFQLAGIKDARAKIIGSNNPLNIVRATFKGLTSQVRVIVCIVCLVHYMYLQSTHNTIKHLMQCVGEKRRL